ncbi:metal ABC transporter solute-binding protein, Zn/Mn family [Sunxiuqinia elliptica]|uniref:Zinc transport system substrate-binding protein n=1 Tax=Sunxiuqinia elliptica TaxID=655355 RepID=A0A4R6H8H3_9BACT|nr:zinc ABC transporter substrate-binding protein [Sunxiuqinia elliptica]TDO03921.1 zinc transport system substrate-binding protein [Sunxiuqinia elliptica]TDO62203.1 zinc transport system substrate-binding protein [Sunxiuqinia elliptica]
MKQLFVFVFILAVACTARKTSEKDLVTVSILPQKYIVEKIAGDLVDVQVLVPPGASPSTYSLVPSQMKDLSRSKVWLRIGKIGFEDAWHEKIEQGNPDLKVFDTSRMAEWIAAEEEVHGDHVHLHGIDPHIWMSPEEVEQVAELTYQALADLYPDKSAAFNANFEAFRSEIDVLDEDLIRQFDGLENRKFIIFHPALTYLARDYGLEQVSLEIDGKEPSAKHMSQLVKTAKDEGIRVVFIQKEFDQENARQLAEELDGEVVQIDPLNENWEEQIREIAEKLIEAANK